MFKRAVVVVSTVVLALSTLTTASPALAATTAAVDLPGLLAIAPVDTNHAYSRDAFPHWIDADADGCNTRYEVLMQESTTPVTIAPPCTITGGTWVSPYDGFATTDVTQIQIDHVVALAEAWRSGAWAWSTAQRQAFANDLDVPYALVAASNSANQSKADNDPAGWMPSNTSYSCEYAISWALIKYRWSLSVDAAELSTLQTALQGECGTTEVQLPSIMVRSSPFHPELDPTVLFPPGVTRLQGKNRYETAVEVSRRYTAGVKAVFVATGQDFPDALSAAAAAARLGGPLLLTPPTALPQVVREELHRLAPERIFIAGGVGAVSAAVENDLRRITSDVSRLGGASRYDTGASIVESTFTAASHVFVATGRTFPDALAATGAAGAAAEPVILVDGSLSSLTPTTSRLISRLGAESVTIVGGPGAVSAGIERQLSSSYDTTRLGGADRYATAARINDAHFPAGSAPAAFLATGADFPDALAGAALAGKLKSPVYVTTSRCVPEPVHVSMGILGAPSSIALGGTAIVSDAAASNLGCLTAAVPVIDGAARAGSTLTVRTGAWTAGTSLQYQWLANGAAVSGATGSTFAITSSAVGKQISVRVTGSASGYLTAVATSAKTAVVLAAAPEPPRYSGYVTAGAYCASQYAGWIGHTVTGLRMQCKTSTTDSRLRWRAA